MTGSEPQLKICWYIYIGQTCLEKGFKCWWTLEGCEIRVGKCGYLKMIVSLKKCCKKASFVFLEKWMKMCHLLFELCLFCSYFVCLFENKQWFSDIMMNTCLISIEILKTIYITLTNIEQKCLKTKTKNVSRVWTKCNL